MQMETSVKHNKFLMLKLPTIVNKPPRNINHNQQEKKVKS